MVQIVIERTPDDQWLPMINSDTYTVWSGKPQDEIMTAAQIAAVIVEKKYCPECDSVGCNCRARSYQ